MASGATLALLSTCTWELANIIATHEAKVKGIVRPVRFECQLDGTKPSHYR